MSGLLRDDKGKFIKGGKGFWYGTKGVKASNSGSFKAGQKPWNNGKRHISTCTRCGTDFYPKNRRTTQRFCSKKCFSDFCAERNLGKPTRTLRKSSAYAKWRKVVLERDAYTCVSCGIFSRYGLHVDHILPIKEHPELALLPDNGRTLCFDCHKLTPTYSNRRNKYVN